MAKLKGEVARIERMAGENTRFTYVLLASGAVKMQYAERGGDKWFTRPWHRATSQRMSLEQFRLWLESVSKPVTL